MDKKIIFLILLGVIALALIFNYGFSLTGHFTNSQNDLNDESNLSLNDELKVLAYCPTMQQDAEELNQDNEYELVKFGSAGEVLLALNKGQIDVALIGRKAEKNELPIGAVEEIIKSGYTLVSNKKSLIDYSYLSSLKIHTNLDESIIKELLPNTSINYVSLKNELKNKILQGEIALISWEDWDDAFELIVVMKGTKKAKEFRGAFLYSIQNN